MRERNHKQKVANPEKAREHQRKWYAANLEKERERKRNWRAANPEKVRQSNEQRLRVSGMYLGRVSFTKREREAMLSGSTD